MDAEKDTPLVEPIEEVPEEDKETDRLLERRVRCPCGTLSKTNFMIQCEDPRCCCWQHTSCVLIPEEAVEAKPPVPDVFYCELCRLSRVLTYSRPDTQELASDRRDNGPIIINTQTLEKIRFPFWIRCPVFCVRSLSGQTSYH